MTRSKKIHISVKNTVFRVGYHSKYQRVSDKRGVGWLSSYNLVIGARFLIEEKEEENGFINDFICM